MTIKVKATQHLNQVTWAAPVKDPCYPAANVFTGFRVYRSTLAAGKFTALTTTIKGARRFNDTNITAGTKYWYYVTAVNVTAESIPSNVVAVIAL